MLHYVDLTKKQKEKICNGCGGKGGWLNPPEFLFHASCNQHDFYYWRGGNEEDRSNADKSFYRFMRLDAKRASKSFTRVKYRIVAYMYYKAVRLFGKKYFEYGKQKTKKDLECLE